MLGTVTRNRLNDITIHALDAERVEHAQCTLSTEVSVVSERPAGTQG